MRRGERKWRYLHSLYETGVASLRGWTVFHFTLVDIIPPPSACRTTQTLCTHKHRQTSVHTKNTEVDGGGDTSKWKTRHSTRKAAAAGVNWLMLLPLWQINSTGQGWEWGREGVWVGGLGSILSSKGLSFFILFLSLCEGVLTLVGNLFCDCVRQEEKASLSTLKITPEKTNTSKKSITHFFKI